MPKNRPPREHVPWDPAETGIMDEKEWRRKVVSHVNDIRGDINDNMDLIEENTELTTNLRGDVRTLTDKMDKHTERVTPVLEAYDKVSKGLEVIGWIGAAFEWMVKKWYIVIACAIAVKVLFFGGSWSDVVKLFKDLPP